MVFGFGIYYQDLHDLPRKKKYYLDFMPMEHDLKVHAIGGN